VFGRFPNCSSISRYIQLGIRVDKIDELEDEPCCVKKEVEYHLIATYQYIITQVICPCQSIWLKGLLALKFR
jgi:hypothetical protein